MARSRKTKNEVQDDAPEAEVVDTPEDVVPEVELPEGPLNWRGLTKLARARGKGGRLNRRQEHALYVLKNNVGVQRHVRDHLVASGETQFAGLEGPAFVETLLQFLKDHQDGILALLKLIISLVG